MYTIQLWLWQADHCSVVHHILTQCLVLLMMHQIYLHKPSQLTKGCIKTEAGITKP